MFEVEKPRRFHYQPRFYDPEKEKWEALKLKYAVEQEHRKAEEAPAAAEGEEDDLDYFRNRVRQLDRESAAKASRFTWRDLFRKREMPQFHYQPRFGGGGEGAVSEAANSLQESCDQSLAEKYRASKRQIKIKRRFDISDSDYMKPIPATKIMLYCLIVFLLLWLILSNTIL